MFHLFDDERKHPFAVIECKKKLISDAEFIQVVEQAWGNGNAYKFQAAISGLLPEATRRFLDCAEKFGALERDKNVIADLPINYGKPPAYKYRKGMSNECLDIKPVSKGELIAVIKKCHQTLWGGGRLSPPAAFGEFCKIIFVKVRDEKARKKGEPYEFQIKTDELDKVHKGLSGLTTVEARCIFASVTGGLWQPGRDDYKYYEDSIKKAQMSQRINEDSDYDDKHGLTANRDHPKLQPVFKAINNLEEFVENKMSSKDIEQLQEKHGLLIRINNIEYWEKILS